MLATDHMLANMSDEASFKNAFERNRDEALANAREATDDFLRDLWTRQSIFWARMLRFIGGEG